jgi:hypothetical protein
VRWERKLSLRLSRGFLACRCGAVSCPTVLAGSRWSVHLLIERAVLSVAPGKTGVRSGRTRCARRLFLFWMG